MTKIDLHAGDNRITLRRLIDEGVRVHSVVTDPPYGLVSIQKRFGKEGAKNARTEGNDGSFARLSAGFMGKAWDGSGIERDPEFWALIYEILLPGGFVFAFSGSRTGHWQACAMEMAGFIMHPMHGWVNFQGMPKAHDAAKAIDKYLGTAGEVVPNGTPVKRMIPGADQHATGSWIKDNGRDYQPGEYVPASEEAVQWNGWKYGTQTQKPVMEPIYLGQKPLEGNGPQNLLKYGVGAMNVDGCRVGDFVNTTPGGMDRVNKRNAEVHGYRPNTYEMGREVISGKTGRHPGNLLLEDTSEVISLFPDSKGQQGDVRGTEKSRTGGDGTHCYGEYGRIATVKREESDPSSARFFHRFAVEPDAVICNPKAGKADRAGSKHPTVKPIALMQYLVRHITPPGGVVLDPFAGSGTTAEAARREGFDCILMEAEEEYLDFLRERFILDKPVAPRDDLFADLLGTTAVIEPVDLHNDLFGDLL